MQRYSSGPITISVDVAANVNTATCEVVELSGFAGGGFVTGAGITSVAFYVCMTRDGTFVALHDATNTAIALTTTAAKGYALPVEAFGFEFLKLVGNAAGTVTLNKKT